MYTRRETGTPKILVSGSWLFQSSVSRWWPKYTWALGTRLAMDGHCKRHRLTVNPLMAKQLTVNRQKRNAFTLKSQIWKLAYISRQKFQALKKELDDWLRYVNDRSNYHKSKILPLHFLYYKLYLNWCTTLAVSALINISNSFTKTSSVHSYNTRSSTSENFYIKASRLEITKKNLFQNWC